MKRKPFRSNEIMAISPGFPWISRICFQTFFPMSGGFSPGFPTFFPMSGGFSPGFPTFFPTFFWFSPGFPTFFPTFFWFSPGFHVFSHVFPRFSKAPPVPSAPRATPRSAPRWAPPAGPRARRSVAAPRSRCPCPGEARSGFFSMDVFSILFRFLKGMPQLC